LKKEIWRSGGTVKQDSTEDNLKSTSGETFAFAQAKLAAGAMNRSERFAIGGTSVNAVRDVETGAARIEATNSNVFSDGNQVNHNHGMSIKNPLQYAAKHATGADATKMGTDDGDFLDNVSGGLVHATSFGGGLIVADQVFNEGKAFKATKRWVKGERLVTDVNGESKWYSKDAIKSMGDDLTPDGKGGFKYESGSLKDADKTIDQRLGSSAVNSPHTNMPPKYNNKPIGMPINQSMESPLNDILPGKYNTIKGNNANKDALNNMDNAEIGRIALGNQLDMI